MKAKNILDRIAANQDDYAKKYKSMLENKSLHVFYNAPCLVIIPGPSHLKNLYIECAHAASCFMTAATARGLDRCLINPGTEMQDLEMFDEMGIPGKCTIAAPIIAGYPEKIPSAPDRRDPEILKMVT